MGNPTSKFQSDSDDRIDTNLIKVKSNSKEKIELEISQKEAIVILPFETIEIKKEYKTLIQDLINNGSVSVVGA